MSYDDNYQLEESINQYDKIQDIILFFSKDITLRFNVSLSYKDRNGNKRFFYNEYQYDSRYLNISSVIGIKRNIRAYLTIEDRRYLNHQNDVYIERGDIPILRKRLETVSNWILGKEETFKLNKRKKLQIMKAYKCQVNIGNGNGLLFTPIIISYDNMQEPGIRMYIGNLDSYIDLSIKTFMDFYECINHMDIYTAACSVIASIPMSKEDAKNNRTLMTNINTSNIDSLNTNNINSIKGYFDKKDINTNNKER